MAHDHKLSELLGQESVQNMLRELAIENEAPEVQAELLDMLGEHIFRSISLEVFKSLPESEYDAFTAFMGSGDIVGLRAFLGKHIPDTDRFLQHTATVAYESVKTRAHRIAEGVDE